MTHPDRHSVKAAGFGAQEWESEAYRPADFQRRPYVEHLRSGGTPDTPQGQLGKVDPNAIKHVLDKGAARVTRINETTRGKLKALIEKGLAEGLSPAELGDRIQASTLFSEYRAERIATTELRMAYNAAALGTYGAMGVQIVVASDGDKDEQCAERDGKAFSILDAEAIEDHPNGTLDWLPVAPTYSQGKTLEQYQQSAHYQDSLTKLPATVAQQQAKQTLLQAKLKQQTAKQIQAQAAKKTHVKYDSKQGSYVDADGVPVEWDDVAKEWVPGKGSGLEKHWDKVKNSELHENVLTGQFADKSGVIMEWVPDAKFKGYGKWQPKPQQPVDDLSTVWNETEGTFIDLSTGQHVDWNPGGQTFVPKGNPTTPSLSNNAPGHLSPDSFGNYGPDFKPTWSDSVSGWVDPLNPTQKVKFHGQGSTGHWMTDIPKPKPTVPPGNIKMVDTYQSPTGYIDKTTGKPAELLADGTYVETGAPTINPQGFKVWQLPDGTYTHGSGGPGIYFDDIAKEWKLKPTVQAAPPMPTTPTPVPQANAIEDFTNTEIDWDGQAGDYVTKLTGQPVQFNPATGNWKLQHPNNKLKWNSTTHQWEDVGTVVTPAPPPNVVTPPSAPIPQPNVLAVDKSQSASGYIDKTTGKPIKQLPDGTYVETGEASINPQGYHVWKEVDGSYTDHKTGNPIVFDAKLKQWKPGPAKPASLPSKNNPWAPANQTSGSGKPVNIGPAKTIVDDIPKRPTHVADQEWTAWQKKTRMAADQKKAQRAYTQSYDTHEGHGYGTINGQLRGTQQFPASTQASVQAQADLMSAGMRPIAQDSRVLRSFRGDSAFPGYSSIEDALQVGNVHIDPAFMSTSVKESWSFGGNVLLDLHVPKGTMGSYVQTFTHHSSEYELLLDRGMHWMVDAVSYQPGGTWYVKAHIVP